MIWTHFSLGKITREPAVLPPGKMPYNSTIWLNGSAIPLSAPFVDIGYGCSGNGVFGSLGNCVCYKGQPISFDLLSEGRTICNTAPGYVWGFSSVLLRLGLAFEATWMACCFTCYLWLSLRSDLVRKKTLRSAGAMNFALEFSETVCEVEQAAPQLSEDDLMGRLDKVNFRYGRSSILSEHQVLRHRVVADTEHRERWIDHTDTRINEAETAVGGWMNETWRRRKRTHGEIYEDLNWDIYRR